MTDNARLWLLIGTVLLTNTITAGVVFMYWQDRFYQLLREQAADRRSRQAQLENIRIREQVYRNVTMGALDNET